MPDHSCFSNKSVFAEVGAAHNRPKNRPINGPIYMDLKKRKVHH